VQSIAAFASLHVSIILTAALLGQILLRSIAVRAVLWAFFTLTCTATIYFGWHYVLDDVGGVAIALVSVLLAGWGTGQFRRRSAVTDEETEPERRSLVGPVAARLRRRPQASPSAS